MLWVAILTRDRGRCYKNENLRTLYHARRSWDMSTSKVLSLVLFTYLLHVTLSTYCIKCSSIRIRQYSDCYNDPQCLICQWINLCYVNKIANFSISREYTSSAILIFSRTRNCRSLLRDRFAFARASKSAGREVPHRKRLWEKVRKKSDLRKFVPTYGGATAVCDSVLTFPLSF